MDFYTVSWIYAQIHVHEQQHNWKQGQRNVIPWLLDFFWQIVQYDNNNNSKLHICDHVWRNPMVTVEFVIKLLIAKIIKKISS